MAIISRSFGSESTIVNADSFTNTEEYSSDVDLETSGYVGSHIDIAVTFHASGAQDVDISIYGSIDGTNYDTIALSAVRIPVTAGATKRCTFIIRDVLHFKVGYKTVAAESNQPTITVKSQPWRWTSV